MKLLRRLWARPSSALGTALVLLFAFSALLAPWIAPYSATERIAAEARQPPSWEHLLGTDHLGRDVFSRVVWGTRSVLALAGLGTLLAAVLGTALGLWSGYRGGWLDEGLMRLFDGLLAIPALLLALLLLGTIGPSRLGVWLAIAILYTPIVARVVRSETLALREKAFVQMARLQGERTPYILFREILLSVLPALSVEVALRFSYAIFLVASLGFLGVGVQPPDPNWGLMVQEARTFVSLTPWALYAPAAAISLLIVGVNLTADGLKRALREPSEAGAPAPQGKARPLPKKPSGSEPSLLEHPEEPVLRVRDLTVAYARGGRWVEAVRDVSLELREGEVYGLVGESGSGKTTLALALLRALDENGAVLGGSIRFRGRDLLGLGGEDLRRVRGAEMGFVPQEPLSALNPSLTVGEQLSEALRLHKHRGRREAWEEAVAWLRRVRIADPERVARRYPHQLSGGQQQRVLIAMALCVEPRLLVLDEPTTGLDVTTEAAVLDLVEELIAEQGTATLYIAHDLGVVARIADRVAVLYAGELVEDAPVRDLFTKPLHPYTRGLLASIPRPGLVGRGPGRTRRSARLPAMRGRIPAPEERPSGCVFAPRCPWARERCFAERPLLEAVARARRVRCHLWREIAEVEAEEKPGEKLRVQSAPEALVGPEAATQPPEPVLEATGLTVRYRLRRSLPQLLRRARAPEVRAVNGVDLVLRRGRTLGLVGESGSGKSSLAHALIGLVEPSAGEIVLRGKPLPKRLSRRDREALQALQMVFQNPDEALNPHKTVGETLRRPFVKLRGLPRRAADEAVAQILEEVRLGADYIPRRPDRLSGGEKQRVAIARAFAARPRVVLCDEPTSALDVSVQARILNLLADLQREEGSAYLFISHDLGVVSYLADEIAVLYLGQIVEHGPTEAVLAPPYHPYTEALLSALPLPDPEGERRRRRERVRLEGEVPSPTELPGGCPFHTRCPRFLGEICVREAPPRREIGPGHTILCHIEPEELLRVQKPLLRSLVEPTPEEEA